LNKLNLTYRKLTDFMASFYFISIVLVSWDRFSLFDTPIKPISAFWDQISILIVGYVTTWSRDSHHNGSLLVFMGWSASLTLKRFHLFHLPLRGVILGAGWSNISASPPQISNTSSSIVAGVACVAFCFFLFHSLLLDFCVGLKKTINS
jgi:hypothetical protein